MQTWEAVVPCGSSVPLARRRHIRPGNIFTLRGQTAHSPPQNLSILLRHFIVFIWCFQCSLKECFPSSFYIWIQPTTKCCRDFYSQMDMSITTTWHLRVFELWTFRLVIDSLKFKLYCSSLQRMLISFVDIWMFTNLWDNPFFAGDINIFLIVTFSSMKIKFTVDV